MRDRSTTDVCSNRPTSTAPPTKLRSAPAPPRRTPHFARGRSETRPQVTAAAPKKIPKPGTKAHAPSTSNGQLRLANGAGRGSIREVCLRSEEHTSELQSPCNLVCRLLLEKKKKVRISTLDLHIIL